MTKHWRYFWYVVRHKWFVTVAAWKLQNRIGYAYDTPCLRILVHDWSKFTRAEWRGYVNWFYGGGKDLTGWSREEAKYCFNQAWKHHWQNNPHHWEWWQRGGNVCSEMTEDYVFEMVADWMGAGRGITGKWDIKEWYEKSRERIKLHPSTRVAVEWILSQLGEL